MDFYSPRLLQERSTLCMYVITLRQTQTKTQITSAIESALKTSFSTYNDVLLNNKLLATCSQLLAFQCHSVMRCGMSNLPHVGAGFEWDGCGAVRCGAIRCDSMRCGATTIVG